MLFDKATKVGASSMDAPDLSSAMCSQLTPSNYDFISREIISDILVHKTYTTEYQPILSPKDSQIFAYEALARFTWEGISLPPKVVFEYCHKNLKIFFDLEMATKEYQFKHRPKNSHLFVNFDPHVLYKKDSINSVFKTFTNHSDFVIEIVENSHKSVKIEKLIEIFKKFKFKFAIDDFFQDNTLLSIFLMSNCDFLKLDKGVLDEIKRNHNFIHIVEGIVKFAKSSNKYVILEGIETSDDLQLALDLKIDFVQGFYYANQFIQK